MSDACLRLSPPHRSSTPVLPNIAKYIRYPGPQSIRSSDTPSRRDLQSPKFPRESRSIRTAILARKWASRPANQSPTKSFPARVTYRRISITLLMYLISYNRASLNRTPKLVSALVKSALHSASAGIGTRHPERVLCGNFWLTCANLKKTKQVDSCGDRRGEDRVRVICVAARVR